MATHRFRPRVPVLALASAVVAAGVLASLPDAETAAATVPPSDSPRFSLSSSLADCPSGLLLSVAYDDHVDGHRPVAVNEQLAGSSGVFWERNELNQVAGDYYGVFAMYLTGQEGPYTYTVTISYDDGATETLSTQVTDGPCDTNALPVPAGQRFEIKQIGYGCPDNAASVEFALFDADDGHVAEQASMSLAEEGGQTYTFVQVLPPGFDARFVSVPFPRLGQPPAELRVTTYTLTMTVTYDDGVEESHSRSVDLAALCGAGTAGSETPSSVPTDQLPVTR
jgi:hypothetical protein